MNPQATAISTDQIDVRSPKASQPFIRLAEPQTYAVRVGLPSTVVEPTIDTAQRERQESLDFLHKLIMG